MPKRKFELKQLEQLAVILNSRVMNPTVTFFENKVKKNTNKKNKQTNKKIMRKDRCICLYIGL